MNQLYACKCCGHKTIESPPPGDYEICPVCLWENDPTQERNADLGGGPNQKSLRDHQKDYLQSMEDPINVSFRKKFHYEKDLSWKPLKLG